MYTVLHHIWHEDDDIEHLITFIGTAFAVGSTALVTNGHIVDALLSYDEDLQALNERWGMDLQADWLLVRNLTGALRYKSNYYFVGRSNRHRDWDADDVFSPDVALLRPSEGTITTYYTMPLATASAARRLRAGTPIGTIGFPGELQFSNLSDLFPVATFQEWHN